MHLLAVACHRWIMSVDLLLKMREYLVPRLWMGDRAEQGVAVAVVHVLLTLAMLEGQSFGVHVSLTLEIALEVERYAVVPDAIAVNIAVGLFALGVKCPPLAILGRKREKKKEERKMWKQSRKVLTPLIECIQWGVLQRVERSVDHRSSTSTKTHSPAAFRSEFPSAYLPHRPYHQKPGWRGGKRFAD